MKRWMRTSGKTLCFRRNLKWKLKRKKKNSMKAGRKNRVLGEQKACWVPETGNNPDARSESQNV